MGTGAQPNVIAKAPVVQVVLTLFSLAAERRYLILVKPCVSEDGVAQLLNRFQFAFVGKNRRRRPEVGVALDRQLVPGDVASASAHGLREV